MLTKEHTGGTVSVTVRAVSYTWPWASTSMMWTPGTAVSTVVTSVTNRPVMVSVGKKAVRGGTASPASMDSRDTGPRMVQTVSTKATFPDRSSSRMTTGHSPASWKVGACSKDTPTSWASVRSSMNPSGPSSSSTPNVRATPRAVGAVVSCWRTRAIRGPPLPETSTTASPGRVQSILRVSKA